MWPFRKSRIVEIDISEAIRSEFKKIQDDSIVLVNSLNLEIQSLKNDCAVKQRTIDEQKENLREQNEADVFLLCEKIKQKVLEGKTKEEIRPDLAQFDYLQNMARQNSLNASYLKIQNIGALSNFY